MKKAMAIVLAMALMMTGCGQSKPAETKAPETKAPETTAAETEAQTEAPETEAAEKTDLIVFAAASMTETLTQIKDLYEAEHKDVNVVYNFDSSGTLKTQIQEGAECDIFISAGQKQMNMIDKDDEKGVNTENLDFVLEGTRINILENKVTLCVSDAENPAVESFDDLAAKLKDGSVVMAMGNSDVPVGQYTQKILAYYELNEEELANAGAITYGTNVKEVTTQVAEASVDCGVVYCTDAFSANLNIVDYGTKEMCGQIIYPAAVLNITQNDEIAKDFLKFIQNDECMKIFEAVGFSRVE